MNDLKETIARVRQLDAKATAGPFTAHEMHGEHFVQSSLELKICRATNAYRNAADNMELFAHYRTAAPKLAAACEDLLAENAKKDERIRKLEAERDAKVIESSNLRLRIGAYSLACPEALALLRHMEDGHEKCGCDIRERVARVKGQLEECQ